ncbi:MAG: TRAP transporter large permease subunit [Treponema sp.]|nr:TRAP transporter large permease subunit [Treponema sp.]
MLKKIEDWISSALVAVLAILPLVLKFIQGALKVPVYGADVAVLNFVFLFSCIAGIVTWRDDRHLNLASFTDKFPLWFQKTVKEIMNAVTVCILTALFLDCICQLSNSLQFTENFWGMNTKVFFAFLPVCYLSMIIMKVAKTVSESGNKSVCWISTAAGLLLAFLISQSSITGILYYLFNIENVPALYAISDAWINFSHATIWLFVVLLIFLAFLGLPLFLVLAGISFVLFSQSGGYVDVIPLETYRILTDRNIAAIPLFTIAGYILSQSSAGSRYVEVFKSLFGWFRGGTVVAAVIVTTFFSTFTGVSGVTILALGGLLTVVLTGNGYDKDRAESLVTSSGAIGLLFPPSAAIIMYASTNYFSVDVFELFKGSIIPGIILAASMIGVGFFFDRQKIRPKFSIKEIGRSLWHCIPELLLPVFICVLYFNGIFDLFEVSAFSVIYAFIVSTIIRKDFNFKKSVEVIASSVPVSGGVLFILGAASGISYFMLDANIPYILTEFINQYVHSPYVFLILMNIFLLIIGCLMDMFSAILIVSPLLLPIAESFGIAPVQAAVIFLLNLSIGFLTPPVGMDLFIASYAFNKPLPKVIKGMMPFFLAQIIVLLLVTYVPWFTLALL